MRWPHPKCQAQVIQSMWPLADAKHQGESGGASFQTSRTSFRKKDAPAREDRGRKDGSGRRAKRRRPRLSVLFEIVDLCQDHACTTRKFSARRRQNSLPRRSVEQNNLILRFQLFDCRRNGLWAHVNGASRFAHAAVVRYRLKVFELRKLHRLLQRQPRRRAVRPQMRFSPRFLPPRTCMWKCMTV